MTIQEIIGYSAWLISFVNMFWYMYSIIHKGTKPTLAYWLIAEIAMILIAVSSYSLGDRTTLWIALAYASTQLVIIGLALYYKNTKLEKRDILFISAALFSLVIWYITDNPFYALVINVAIDAMGYIPLLRNIYRDPNSEDRIYWWIAAFACVLNMFAVREISLEATLYPWYLGIINTITFILLFRKTLITYGKKIYR